LANEAATELSRLSSASHHRVQENTARFELMKNSLEQREILERLVTRSARMYSLPGAAIRLLERIEDPHCELEELRDILSSDPALSARLLRVVNSAFFGLSTKVSTLSQAVALLGRNKLRLVVLGFSLPDGLFRGVEQAILARYWHHTLYKAVTVREITVTRWPERAEETFLVGLFEDLGLLCLLQQLGTPFYRLVHLAWESGNDLLALERKALGFDHRQLTARLLQRWTLPEEIVLSVQYRAGAERPWIGLELPPPAQRFSSAENVARFHACLLSVADLCLQVWEDGHSHSSGEACRVMGVASQAQITGLTEHFRWLGLKPENLDVVQQTVAEKVSGLAELLQVELISEEMVAQIQKRAQARLAETAAAAAAQLLQLESICFRSSCDEGSCSSTPPDGTCAIPSPTGLGKGGSTVLGGEPAASECSWAVKNPQATCKPVSRTRVSSGSESIVRPDHGDFGCQYDPTSITADPGLIGFLSGALTACRAQRCPLSLLLIEIQATEDEFPLLGPDTLERLRTRLFQIAHFLQIPRSWIFPYGDWGLAVVLFDHERSRSTELAHHFLRSWKLWRPESAPGCRLQVGLAAGVVTASIPHRGLTPEDFLQRAERCLFGSRACGGVLKSIEI
jgi:HD-like signal output (HDOD) protein